jgi:hypothetical protein
MAKTPKNPAKKPTATPQKPRQLKSPSYRSFSLQKKISAGPKLPSAFHLFRAALGILKKHWKLFSGILAIYGLLSLILVQGMTSLTDLSENKSALESTVSGGFSEVLVGATLFVQLLGGGSTATSPTASVYQLVLVLILSLVLIWTLRQLYAGNKVRIRDGFYLGMYPLVPFILVLFVIVLQLLPLVFGGAAYATVASNGIAASAAELILWAAAFFILALLSLYMVCSSIFALYIVCLPDMQPMQALRSARELVRNRRWTVLRKVIFLPLILVVLGGLLIIPVILFATGLAGWIFFLLSLLALGVIHSYMYGLYRSLI